MKLLKREPVSSDPIVVSISNTITKAFLNGSKLLICGNGGSAAMSQHMASEFMSQYQSKRKPLPAIALTTDTSFITSYVNDNKHGFTNLFARQVEALGCPQDVLITFSTSGLSANITAAETVAKAKGMQVITMPRQGDSTPRIQEYQLRLMHEVVSAVECLLCDVEANSFSAKGVGQDDFI